MLRIISLIACLLGLIVVGCMPASSAPPAASPQAVAPTEAPPVGTVAAASPTASSPSTPTATAITIVDTAGRTVTLSGVPQRIISLAPSTTEILFALGLGPKVLAVDEFSNYPVEVKSRPKVGGLQGQYNLEQIVALKPDLVVASGISSPEAINRLQTLNLTVVVVGGSKTTLESILTDIQLVGRLTGRTAEATQRTDAMKEKLATITNKVATVTKKPRVYWELDGTDPAKPFAVGPGNFIDEILTVAGGVNIFQNGLSPFPQVSAEQIVAANPEVIILSDAAYGISPESVGQRPGWQAIEAAQRKRIYPIDDDLVSRQGPRAIDGLEAAAKLIHPELFP